MTATSLAPAALAAGCGGGSGGATTSSGPTVTGSFPARGITFTPPRGWTLSGGSGPLVAAAQAGQATVAVWRYPRTERLPKTKAELKAARDALITASERRDRTFQVIKSAATTVAGKPAVQIRARETIAGQPRTIRSTHIYSGRAEIVVDAYVDADSFRKTDAEVFRPLLRSLQVHAPRSA